MASHEDLERTIIDLLRARATDSSICPSEAARELDGEEWRELMGPVREVAGSLAEAGTIEVTQRGAVVDVGSARGPVRLRRGAAWADTATPDATGAAR